MSASPARWIRLGPVSGERFEAACVALARDQIADAPVVVLWAEAQSDLRIAQCAGPESAIWIEGGEHAMAVIVHRTRAPGRVQRWAGWALNSVVAAYRRFGLHAYWDENAGGPGLVWLQGAPVAHGAVSELGNSALIVAGLDLRELPGLPLRVSTPGALSGGVWRPIRPVCSRDFEKMLMQGLEAQHGWVFEHSWLSDEERRRIADVRLPAAA